MRKFTIQVTTSTFGEGSAEPIRMLEEADCEVRLNPFGRKITAAELGEMLGDVDGLIAGTETIDRNVIERAPILKVISRVGIGVDSIDRDAVQRASIKLYKTDDSHVEAVAQLTLAFMLDALRRHIESDRQIRKGVWFRPMGKLLHQCTVGFLGFGRVPRRVAQFLAPFDLRLLAHDPLLDYDSAQSLGVEYSTLDALLSQSDVISLHAPGSAGAILGEAEFKKVKNSVVLINTARGNLIDEHALVYFLRRNAGARAAIDTFETEPYSGPLSKLENTILTAHLGGYSKESRVEMEMHAAHNCLVGLGVMQ